MFEYYLTLFIEAVFVENIALAYFLGMCTFLAISKRVNAAIGLGITVIFLLTLTVPINNLIYTYFLNENALTWIGITGTDLRFVGLITYIGIIAAVVQILEMFLDKYFLIDSSILNVPTIFVLIKPEGSLIELSTCVSAARLKIQLGLYLFRIFKIFLFDISHLINLYFLFNSINLNADRER